MPSLGGECGNDDRNRPLPATLLPLTPQPATPALLSGAGPNLEKPLLFITYEALSICRVLWNSFFISYSAF